MYILEAVPPPSPASCWETNELTCIVRTGCCFFFVRSLYYRIQLGECNKIQFALWWRWLREYFIFENEKKKKEIRKSKTKDERKITPQFHFTLNIIRMVSPAHPETNSKMCGFYTRTHCVYRAPYMDEVIRVYFFFIYGSVLKIKENEHEEKKKNDYWIRIILYIMWM